MCIMRFALDPSITEDGSCIALEISAPPPPGSPPEYQHHVMGSVVLANTGLGLTAEGHLKTVATLACSRCAREHTVDISISVSEECALEDIDQPSSYEEDEYGDFTIPILNGRELDLSALVVQLLALNLPLHSLCRPDCRGLCAQCGQDLNEGTCDCSDEEIDPRLSVLKDIQPHSDD